MEKPNSPPSPPTEKPLTTRLLDAASALNILADSDSRRLMPELVADEMALLRSLPALLAEAASELHGKHAVLRGLMDAYTAAGGDGVATHEAIHAAIKHGVGAPQLEADCAALRKAFEEASGGKSPTVPALVEAIHRGAR